MKKAVIIILVVAVIATLVILNLNQNREDDGTPVISTRNAVSVKACGIEKGSISSYITARGRVEETEKAQVFFDTPLRVLEVFVDKNDRVNEGDRLLELDTQTFVEEMSRLTLQKEIQSITLEKLEAGQNLLSLETNMTSAKNAVDNALDHYQTACSEYEKQKRLYETGVSPKTQLDQYERTMKDAKTALDNARLNLDSAEKTYQSSVGGHDLDIQAQIKNIQLLSSQIADIEKKLEKTASLEKAPISGYITEVFVTEGAYTGSGQPAFTITDTDNIRIAATVNEYNSQDLAVGQKVTITGEAFGDHTEFQGKVVSVAPVATDIMGSNGQETVVEVFIEPLEGKEALKPGLNVDCDIVTQQKDNIVVAEFNIFAYENRDRYVMVIDENTMTVRKQHVTQGIYSDMQVEIIEGLKEGDTVVIDPQPSLSDGDRVRIME